MSFAGRTLSFIFFAAVAAFGQPNPLINTSIASYGPIVAPDSLAAGWGTGLSTATASGSAPLPTMLASTQVIVTDSGKTSLAAPLLLVSPSQVNYLVPANFVVGRGTAVVQTSGSSNSQGPLLISNIAPAIFTANMDGRGVPAAQILRVNGSTSSIEVPFQTQPGTSTFIPAPINVATQNQLYLMLYGTGIRRHSLNPVKATIGGVSVPVLYAGAQSQYPGLDQVNVGPLPSTLAGKGLVQLTVWVDGVPTNAVALSFQ